MVVSFPMHKMLRYLRIHSWKVKLKPTEKRLDSLNAHTKHACNVCAKPTHTQTHNAIVSAKWTKRFTACCIHWWTEEGATLYISKDHTTMDRITCGKAMVILSNLLRDEVSKLHSLIILYFLFFYFLWSGIMQCLPASAQCIYPLAIQ